MARSNRIPGKICGGKIIGFQLEEGEFLSIYLTPTGGNVSSREGNIYMHVCLISNLITFCRDTFVYRIAEIYIANTKR